MSGAGSLLPRVDLVPPLVGSYPAFAVPEHITAFPGQAIRIVVWVPSEVNALPEFGARRGGYRSDGDRHRRQDYDVHCHSRVYLRPLPFPDLDRLVTIWERDATKGIDKHRVTPANFVDWSAQKRVDGIHASSGFQSVGDIWMSMLAQPPVARFLGERLLLAERAAVEWTVLLFAALACGLRCGLAAGMK